MRRRGAKPHSSRRPRASGSGGTIGQRQNRAGGKHSADLQGAAVVVLIPCLNEEQTVGKVVRDFRREAPFARIVVCDNGSIDQSVEAARQAGAEVVSESKRGKGHVVQSMFRTVRGSRRSRMRVAKKSRVSNCPCPAPSLRATSGCLSKALRIRSTAGCGRTATSAPWRFIAAQAVVLTISAVPTVSASTSARCAFTLSIGRYRRALQKYEVIEPM